MVRKCSYKLKDTHISIGEQFPKEIQERWKKLLPIYKRAKENNRKAVLARDKLFIDGKLYSDDGPVQMKSTPTQPKASGGRGQKTRQREIEGSGEPNWTAHNSMELTWRSRKQME